MSTQHLVDTQEGPEQGSSHVFGYRVEIPGAKAMFATTLKSAYAMIEDMNLLMPKDIIGLRECDFDKRHGGPYDRGSADAYYRRPMTPHFYQGATGCGLVEEKDMTREELIAYEAGFWHNHFVTRFFKDWD